MTRVKPRGKYMAISIPIAMYEEISEYVKKTSFNSIADFVKYAVRKEMEKDKQ
jgi:Arc/MetJ-type ribon-helix-helix transcriptional regulator